jgi:hypothetical protein
MKAVRILVTALGLAVGVSAAAGQPAKLLRDQLVGTWSFVIAEITAADGKKSLPFGDRPKGMLIFTADGHFSQVHVADGLPKIASNNRLAGTAEDNKAIVAGTLALFGTYSVDEAKRTVTFPKRGRHRADPDDRRAHRGRISEHQSGRFARWSGRCDERLPPRKIAGSAHYARHSGLSCMPPDRLR